MGEATPARVASEPMRKPGSFGDRLKRERESRGISLDDVSISTKIGLRMLRALEEEKFDQLPGGIFNKGFVRAYARHLGIDEEQAVADYLEAVGETMPPAAPEPVVQPPPVAREPESKEPGMQVPWGVLALILILAALALSLWSYRTRQSNPGPRELPAETSAPAQVPDHSQTPAPNPPNPTNSVNPANPANLGNPSAPATDSPGASPAPSPSPASPAADKPAATREVVPSAQNPKPGMAVGNNPGLATAVGNSVKNSSLLAPDAKPAAEPAPRPPAAPAPFVVLIEAEDNSWVSITADGKTILEGTLIAPAVKAVKAQNQVVVRAGNIAALNFSFNGKKLAPQGDPGEVKTLTFSANGLAGALPKPAN